MTDEKPVIVEKLEPEKPVVDKRPQPIPDFTAMPFEKLMSTQHKPDNDKFNKPLWQEQCERLKKLGIAPLDDFEAVDSFQDKIAARVTKLERKFELLTKLIEETGIIDLPRFSMNQYLEDKTK